MTEGLCWETLFPSRWTIYDVRSINKVTRSLTCVTFRTSLKFPGRGRACTVQSYLLSRLGGCGRQFVKTEGSCCERALTLLCKKEKKRNKETLGSLQSFTRALPYAATGPSTPQLGPRTEWFSPVWIIEKEHPGGRRLDMTLLCAGNISLGALFQRTLR